MLWSHPVCPRESSRGATQSPATAALRRYLAGDEGSLTIFTLFIFVVILMICGMAVDLMRFESKRVALQSTLDRAVLAAANMDQTLEPDDVVADYFNKSGIAGVQFKTHSDKTTTFRNVQAASSVVVRPFFMQLLGIDSLAAPASGGAHEGLTKVEISLVLDVSGSMKDNDKLTNLKAAAKDFVDTVLAKNSTTSESLTDISIIPFSTQVNAGATIASYLNYSGEQNTSFCVDWQSADFDTATVKPTDALRQTGHFDTGSSLATSSKFQPVCYTDASRQILAYQDDPDVLKTFIGNLYYGGYTSIEIGAKWGAALLDPAFQPVVTGMIKDKQVNEDFANRPAAYSNGDVLKVMIVMSDGTNTNQWWLNDDFQSGMSNIWYDASADKWSVVNATLQAAGNTSIYWHKSDAKYYTSADGANAKQLSWPEVWSLAGVGWVKTNLIKPMLGSSLANAWESSVYTKLDNTVDKTSNGTGVKDDRTSRVCGAAKKNGVTVYTIGFETDTAGDAALRDCATASSYFFHAEGTQISDVFSVIAADISQLKLTN